MAAMQTAPVNGTIMADSLWLHGMNFPATFLRMNRDYYGADVKRLMAAPSPVQNKSAQDDNLINVGLWSVRRDLPLDFYSHSIVPGGFDVMS